MMDVRKAAERARRLERVLEEISWATWAGVVVMEKTPAHEALQQAPQDYLALLSLTERLYRAADQNTGHEPSVSCLARVLAEAREAGIE